MARRPTNPTLALSLPGAKATEVPALAELPARYEDRGLLGTGGMGEVRRVWDRELQRHLAMKLLRPELVRGSLRARFLAEARLNAQLQHPGIVSVHDAGELPDGRAWFTMREVQGRTLADLIADVHAAPTADWQPTPDGWSLRRLLGVLASVCETVAYAHSRGIVHRDLKPRNVMVGRFGEVQVMDWGLARSRTQASAGSVVGTPGYMSPEQARGGPVQPAMDVFALAACLYEVLVGHPPYPPGKPGLAATLEGPPPPPRGARVPPELAALAARGLSPDPAARSDTAQALGASLRSWLDGLHRREQALDAVREAEALWPRVVDLRAQAAAAREAARRLLDGLAAGRPEEDRWPGWAQEDAAVRLEREAEVAEVAYTQALHAALQVDPEAVEPHERLADYWRGQVLRAGARGDPGAAARAELHLRRHDRGRHARFLEGVGAVSLVTDPPGAVAEVYRYVEQNRVLVPELVVCLGPTPLRAVELPQGSYLFVLRAEGRAAVRYPVQVRREEHWDGVPPEGGAPCPIFLPEALGPEEVYVPAGWFWSGGDPQVAEPLPRRALWLDGFVLERSPVTLAAWCEFLDRSPGDEGRVPQFRPAGGGATPICRRDAQGWTLLPDPMGRSSTWDEPVRFVTWEDAWAYAAYRARQDGVPWRLPYSVEREKAGRGVDGRRWPWGDHYAEGRCNVVGGLAGVPRLTPVDAFPRDESLYGARGLAGNVRDWCADTWTRHGPAAGRYLPSLGGEFVLVLGGSAHQGVDAARLARRYVARPEDALGNVGLRLARFMDPFRTPASDPSSPRGSARSRT